VHGILLSALALVLSFAVAAQDRHVTAAGAEGAPSTGGLRATAGTPYSGTPAPIPGRIEAENYDRGGEGVAYHDLSEGNAGGHYRTDNVDIKISPDGDGGYAIGWFQAGEWLEYTVNVTLTALYDLRLRLGSIYPDRTLVLTLNGTNIAGAVAVPVVAAWDTPLVTVTVSNVLLRAGTQVLRVTVGPQDWVDLNWIDFRAHVGTMIRIAGRDQ